ncbi:MAG: DUF3786 domain-containing protein [Deltaproteobacteria bacterium]|jgi:hypothetical protein|nr:DUF3786 domain-containing protein [Deltaproteobacteria bacterium]
MSEVPFKSGYQKIYEWVASSLPGFDLAANAPHLGLELHPEGGVVVPLLGRNYLVETGGVRALDGNYAHFNRLSLAGHYAMSQGRGAPALDFVKLSVLSGTPMGTGGGSLERDRISGPLVKKFEQDFSGLESAISRLGGRPVPDISGGRSWLIHALPLIVLKLIFYPADEEFEADFVLLYDRRSPEFMEFEALAFLGGSLVEELTNDL